MENLTLEPLVGIVYNKHKRKPYYFDKVWFVYVSWQLESQINTLQLETYTYVAFKYQKNIEKYGCRDIVLATVEFECHD